MSLTRTQKSLLRKVGEGENIFEAATALNICHARLLLWREEPGFRDAMKAIIELQLEASRIDAATAGSLAAKNLKELCSTGKGETARKACLDILSGNFLPKPISSTGQVQTIPPPGQENAPSESPGLDPAKSARILAGLAEPSNNGATCFE